MDSFHVGGGIQLIELVTIAADASFDNPELLGNSGTRLGVSFVLQPLPFLRIDGGISKWGNETIRFPLGLIFITGKKDLNAEYKQQMCKAHGSHLNPK